MRVQVETKKGASEMTIYAIAEEPWKQENGYPSRFKKDVFAKKSDAIVAFKRDCSRDCPSA